MVGNTKITNNQALPTDDAFTLIGFINYLMTPIMVAGAAFAPTARGIWIFCAFLLPPIIYVTIRMIEKRTSGYRYSTVLATFPFNGFLAIIASFLLPYAFIGLDTPFLWGLWASLAAVLLAGLLIGLARHDPEMQKRSIARRYTPRNGRLEMDIRKDEKMGMRDSTGLPIVDTLLKVVWWLYCALILVAMVVGGAAGYILIDLLDGRFALPPDMDMRVMIIMGVAMLGLGPLAMFMPALLLRWKEVARLEKLARQSDKV